MPKTSIVLKQFQWFLPVALQTGLTNETRIVQGVAALHSIDEVRYVLFEQLLAIGFVSEIGDELRKTVMAC